MSIPYPTGFKSDNPEAPAQDRGLFDCFGKKEEKEDVPMTETEHKPSLMEKLNRSGSSSSSSSEEEVEEDGVKIRRRKKKGLTDKIKAKLPGHKNEGPTPFAEGDYNHQHAPEGMHSADDNKGFLEKIKEKMPGNHKNEGCCNHQHVQEGIHSSDEDKGVLEKIKDKMPGNQKDETLIAAAPPPAYTAAPTPVTAPESQEKKGFIEKIMEKFPGGHKDGDEVKKSH